MKTPVIFAFICAAAFIFGGCSNAAPPTAATSPDSALLQMLKPTHPRLLVADDS